MALHDFHNLVHQLGLCQAHYFVGKGAREFEQFVQFGFHVHSSVLSIISESITPAEAGAIIYTDYMGIVANFFKRAT
jgi:hypothetical protein